MRDALTPLAFVLSVAIAACWSDPSESRLRRRVERYGQLIITQQYSQAWSLLSPRMRAGNDDDPRQYAEGFETAGLSVAEFEPMEVRLFGDRAVVRVRVRGRFERSGESVTEAQEQSWVRSGDEWFFDDYRTE